MDLRQSMNIMEIKYHDAIGRDDISYKEVETKGVITKIVATLKSDASGKYTKLGRNLNRIKWLSEKIDQLKEEVKADTKTEIADLFHAEDACLTRVVDTVSFTFELTKDPKPTTTVQYAKVLDALQDHLTPELIEVLEGLKRQFSNTVQKSPALKATDKRYPNESIDLNESVWDKLKAYASKFYDYVKRWGSSYDAKLNALRAQVGMSESLEESMFGHPHEDIVDQLIEAAVNLGKAKGGMISNDMIRDWEKKVEDAKSLVLKHMDQN